ncbi:MAG: substrate-binding domain-containing protein [Dehalococcoidia bacterium]|nr:substrate-binding domain-containing protein [Dehalococcoidia bacterium]
MKSRWLASVLLLWSLLSSTGCNQANSIILATTTSVLDSGLLSVLVPVFQDQTGYKVKPIAVGSGQAIALGERGEVDVLLVHAPDSEKKFMEAGHGIDRRPVMHNDFVIVGPASDPAGIRGLTSAAAAFSKIAQNRAIFTSRGDNSGTHQLETKLWREAGIEPRGQTWYQTTGQGMGQTLAITAEKQGYTLTDRATHLATARNTRLAVLVEGDTVLKNTYHVILVNPDKSPLINAQGARALADFLVSAETQKLIAEFGTDKYGSPLFHTGERG